MAAAGVLTFNISIFGEDIFTRQETSARRRLFEREFLMTLLLISLKIPVPQEIKRSGRFVDLYG